MAPAELQDWLVAQAEDIRCFTDFEPEDTSEHELAHRLEAYWFRDAGWNQPRYHFVPLGHDGSGGQFALWTPSRAGATPCVVFFGSEGGRGVLAPSSIAFLQALGHGAMTVEYDRRNLHAPSRLATEDNWLLSDEDVEKAASAREALLRYRAALEAVFGPLPPFAAVTTVPPGVQTEFCDWVDVTCRRVAEQDKQESARAAEAKREALRAKATVYASAAANSLPDLDRKDGLRYEGACSSCGQITMCRWTRFEELGFGLCTNCYFSVAW